MIAFGFGYNFTPMIRTLVFILILISFSEFLGLHICYSQDAEVFNEDFYQLEEPGPYYYFFAGAGYGSGKENNLFTRTFIDTMESIEGINFRVVEGIYFNTLARNSTWAVFHAQKPLRQGDKHKFMEAALTEIRGKTGEPSKNVTLISSSSGTVVAAQAALLLATNREAYGLGEIHLVLGYSPIHKASKLYRDLLLEVKKGNITSIIYDDLQGTGDNITGMAGRTRSEAFARSVKVLFPIIPDRFFWPSLINANTEHGHPHHVSAATREKAYRYVKTIFTDGYMADKILPSDGP